MPNPTTKTEKTTAYLVVYEVSRHYGGPEEGGWWYDQLTHTGVAIPFKADVKYDLTHIYDHEGEERAEAMGLQTFQEYDGAGGDADVYAWDPTEIDPDPEDLEWYRLAHTRLDKEYSLNAGPQRFSMAPRGEDYQLFHETTPGWRQFTKRPRYA
jgi:hypothetical protein